MNGRIIPSGSLGKDDFTIPDWAKPTEWWGVEIGCLARVLPLGGEEWRGELVIVLAQIDEKDSLKPTYKVVGKKGVNVFPYYALSVEGYNE